MGERLTHTRPTENLEQLEMGQAPVMEELASRQADGLRVYLMWNTEDGNGRVDVFDFSKQKGFSVPVDSETAADVYRSPLLHEEAATECFEIPSLDEAA